MFKPVFDRTTTSSTEAREIESKIDARRNYEFNLPNSRNIALMEKLKGANPAYAKDALTKNELLKVFAYKLGGGIDILKQPVCGRCEMPCTWGTYDYKEDIGSKDKFATCDCGNITKNPITVEQYLLEYLKGVDSTFLDACRPSLNAELQLMDAEELKGIMGAMK